MVGGGGGGGGGGGCVSTLQLQGEQKSRRTSFKIVKFICFEANFEIGLTYAAFW